MIVGQRVVEILVWDCGNPDHRHLKKDVAERCAEKQRAPRRKPRNRTNDDYRQALLWRRGGSTFRSIGERLGVSGGRAAQIVRKAERKLLWYGGIPGIETLIVRGRDDDPSFVVYADMLDVIDNSYHHDDQTRYFVASRNEPISFDDWERMRTDRIADKSDTNA